MSALRIRPEGPCGGIRLNGSAHARMMWTMSSTSCPLTPRWNSICRAPLCTAVLTNGQTTWSPRGRLTASFGAMRKFCIQSMISSATASSVVLIIPYEDNT